MEGQIGNLESHLNLFFLPLAGQAKANKPASLTILKSPNQAQFDAGETAEMKFTVAAAAAAAATRHHP